MSHTADVAQAHNTEAVEEGKTEKGVALALPGAGAGSLWLWGELLTYKIPSPQTGGAYALFEVTTQPNGGPPPHIQHREDEAFYVFDGEYEFLVDSNTTRAGAGSLLYVPKGTVHAHRVVGESAGKMLMSQTPGGLYERFFEKVGRPADGDHGGPPIDDGWAAKGRRIVEVAAEHGIEISSPIAR
jgi:quercetin dioxygenase-like cupin family protein